MERLTSVEEFRTLQSRVIAALDPTVPTIVIPAGTCVQASGASDLIRVAKRYLLEKRLTDKVRLRISGCHGFCEMEPSVLIEPQKTFYPRVSMRDVSRI
ncbi:MAG TPA: (2Fe-2S) ferredoxin domain-containing protein, partial [Armatimonadota bacterium]|nr:(2Fe-2S) ferredoxin domain-containing protein [Armatimonadota bacterium]